MTLIVERMDQEYAWWAEKPQIVYRKGDKFRIDNPFDEIAATPQEKPAPAEDMAAWWNNRSKNIRYYTQYIIHSTTRYTSKIDFAADADGSRHVDLKSVDKYEENTIPGEIYPPYYARLPEFACRPPLGIPHQKFEPVLDLNPKAGPAASVLLHIRGTGRMPEAKNPNADDSVKQPDAYRFWLDPERGYAVVRWDNLGPGDSGNEEVMSSRVIEELAKSPQGIWYATRVRRRNSVRMATGEAIDDLRYIYVDFDADLPDSLFEIPKPGRIH